MQWAERNCALRGQRPHKERVADCERCPRSAPTRHGVRFTHPTPLQQRILRERLVQLRKVLVRKMQHKVRQLRLGKMPLGQVRLSGAFCFETLEVS